MLRFHMSSPLRSSARFFMNYKTRFRALTRLLSMQHTTNRKHVERREASIGTGMCSSPQPPSTRTAALAARLMSSTRSGASATVSPILLIGSGPRGSRWRIATWRPLAARSASNCTKAPPPFPPPNPARKNVNLPNTDLTMNEVLPTSKTLSKFDTQPATVCTNCRAAVWQELQPMPDQQNGSIRVYCRVMHVLVDELLASCDGQN